jgi:hypothetical protein
MGNDIMFKNKLTPHRTRILAEMSVHLFMNYTKSTCYSKFRRPRRQINRTIDRIRARGYFEKEEIDLFNLIYSDMKK